MRVVSDLLDNAMGWNNDASKAQSGVRRIEHGVYHSAVGVIQLATAAIKALPSVFGANLGAG